MYTHTTLRRLLRYSSIICIPLLCILIGSLFLQAYGNGVYHSDTTGFYGSGVNYSFLNPSWYDLDRPPMYGWLIYLTLQTSSPAYTIVWVHFFFYAISMLGIYIFCRSLGMRHATSLFVNFCIIGMEFLLFNSLWYHLFLVPDQLYGHISILGIMLLIAGHVQKSPRLLLAGSLCIGITAWLKRIAIALIIIWIPFVIFAIWRQKRTLKARIFFSSALALCMCNYNVITAIHNGYLYGTYKSTAKGNIHLLATVLPLLDENDVLVDNPEKNRNIIANNRLYIEKFGRFTTNYLYYGNNDPLNPLTVVQEEVIRSLEPSSNRAIWHKKMMFAKADLSGKWALKIIRSHPWEYAKQVLGQMRLLLSYPLYTQLNSKLHVIHHEAIFGESYESKKNLLALLYRPHSIPDINQYGSAILRERLMTIGKNRFRTRLMQYQYWFFLLPTLCYLYNIGWLIVRKKTKMLHNCPNFYSRLNWIAILFCTTIAFSMLLSSLLISDNIQRYTAQTESLMLLSYCFTLGIIFWQIQQLYVVFITYCRKRFIRSNYKNLRTIRQKIMKKV